MIELRQQLKLAQQLIMTPQLQMAIKLLQLSRLELIEAVKQELVENPALEEASDYTEEVEAETSEIDQEEIPLNDEFPQEEKIRQDIDWDNYINEFNSTGRMHLEYEKKELPSFENFVASKKTLQDHLLWQLLMSSPGDEEKRIGSIIIGNINPDGYFDGSVEDIAQEYGFEHDRVETVLSMVQGFDPPGVGGRNLKEVLLIQARQLSLHDSIVERIISDHLLLLEKKNYKAIARATGSDMDEIMAAVKIIRGLEPKPGRIFSGEEPQYIIPDIYIFKTEDDFVIMLNDDGLPRLKVSRFYREIMNRDKDMPHAAKSYINERLNSATWLIRSIHQRQKTIYRVTKSILKYQREFFEKGIQYLRPLVLKDVAQDIEMHESTVSRVTTNKYAYTPQGIFELKFFFSSSINRFNGAAIASASVQEKIRKIIESENPKKPYSDKKIAEILKEDNIDIARRTVAKYREMMKILPSSKRKEP